MNTSNDATGHIPDKCEICGRQDDTIRYVSYPFVFSFVVLTFQRAFTGCWCRFHRIQRWFAASFITSIFGWLGIPFGIALTPVRLLQLARGGLKDNALNGQMLHLIGEQKLQSGDSQGAIRCFEASLLYVDNEGISEQLRTLYRSLSSTGESAVSGMYRLLLFPMISIGFAIIGLIVGVLDYIVRWFSSFLTQELSIFILILLQVPFVILVYFCGAFLSYIFRIVVRFTRVNSTMFLSIASLVTSLLFVSGIVSGSTYGIYFSYFRNGIREMPDEIPYTMVAILTRSIFYIFSPSSFTSNFSGNVLFAVLLSLSFLLFILTLMPTIKMVAVQQERISRLQTSEGSSGQSFPILGMVGLFGLFLGFALLFIAAPQKSSIDALKAFDHFVIGYSYLNSSQPDQAIAEYRAAIELKPRFALAHILLGNAYLSLGETDKAHDSFLTAVTLEPENPTAHTGLGWSFYHQGKNDLAKSKFLEALELDAQNLDAHLGLGWVNMQDGNYDLAEKKFKDVLNVDNQNLNGHLGLGWAYLNQSDAENSRKEFEYVKSIAPDLAEAYYGLGTLELSNYHFENAVLLLDESLRLNPNNIFAYLFKGYAWYRQCEYSAAESAFQSALKIQPSFYDALVGLGNVRVSMYEFESGLNYYDKAIAADPKRVDAYLDKAYVLAQMGRFDEAIELIEPFDDVDGRIMPTMAFMNYLKDFPLIGDELLRQSISYVDTLDGYEKGQGYMSIAAIKFSLADFTEAIKYSELAAKKYPFGLDADSYFLVARSYSALGDYDHVQEALDNGSNIGHSEISLHLTVARILIDQEELDEAYKELQDVLNLDSENSDAHAFLSFIYFQQGNLPRASFAAKTALNLNPYNYYAHQQLAFVYHAQGNVNEALTEAQEAVRLQTLDSASHYILGVCYMETGQTEDALNEFEQFLDLYWDRAYVRDYKVKAEEYLEQLEQSP